MKTITIQGVEIPLKEQDCIRNGEKALSLDPYVNISVYLTNSCNASCKFCCNINAQPFVFDVEQFKRFIDYVSNVVTIKKITFTGGEPSLNTRNLLDCITYIRNSSKVRDAKIVVFTNGSLLKKYHDNLKASDIFEIHMIFEGVDNMAVSCHHWDWEVNNAIMGINSKGIFKNFPYIGKVNLSCNLINGYVDSSEGVCKMLEFAGKNNITQVAFVKLMPINSFCEEKKVEFPSLQGNPNVLEYEKWEYVYPNICECDSFVYRTKKNKLVKFYMRSNKCPSYNMGSYIIYKNNQIQTWYK